MMCSLIVPLFSYTINLIIVVIVLKNSPTSYLSHSAIVQLHNFQHTTKVTQLHLSNINYNQNKFIVSLKCTVPIIPLMKRYRCAFCAKNNKLPIIFNLYCFNFAYIHLSLTQKLTNE